MYEVNGCTMNLYFLKEKGIKGTYCEQPQQKLFAKDPQPLVSSERGSLIHNYIYNPLVKILSIYASIYILDRGAPVNPVTKTCTLFTKERPSSSARHTWRLSTCASRLGPIVCTLPATSSTLWEKWKFNLETSWPHCVFCCLLTHLLLHSWWLQMSKSVWNSL